MSAASRLAAPPTMYSTMRIVTGTSFGTAARGSNPSSVTARKCCGPTNSGPSSIIDASCAAALPPTVRRTRCFGSIAAMVPLKEKFATVRCTHKVRLSQGGRLSALSTTDCNVSADTDQNPP